jgi:agmatine deiminase
MLWPERPDNWRNGAKPAQKVFTEVAKAISKFEPVTVGVNYLQYDNARHHLPENIRVVEMSNDDSWIRDCGATFVTGKCKKSGKMIKRGISWKFNAWGGLVDGLYFPWDKDDQVAKKMCEIEYNHFGAGFYSAGEFILEGGSIHVDGEGTLVTTKECLLSEGRNSNLSQKEIEDTLKKYLNLEKIIWLDWGIYNDETNGHIDNMFNFVEPGKVVLAWTDDKNDPQYKRSQLALETLENSTDAKGRKFEVHKMYTPKPVLIEKEEAEGVDAVDGTLPRTEGDRLAASYCNYYTANGGIALPVFGDPADEKAIKLLEKLYPKHEVVPIYAREILLGGGNIHCITQQIPKV